MRGNGQSRVQRRAGVLLATLALLAGCAGGPGDGGEDGTSSSGDGSFQEIAPSELVGLWRVAAEDEASDTWLRIAPDEVTLWRECGAISGHWAFGTGAVLTSVQSWSGECDDPDLPEIGWLQAVRGFAADGDARVLLDESGEVLARLTVDGAPPESPNVADEYREPPSVSADDAAELDDLPATPPDGLELAAAQDLIGRWIPTSDHETEPYLELADDGTWSGSDGCNGQGGGWLLDQVGALLVTAGLQTAIGCDGESLGSLLVSSTWLGVEGDVLTFYDVDGGVVGEVVRG